MTPTRVARVSALLFCCISAAVPGGASGRPKIALAGDSTVNQGTGWGPGFSAAFSPDVEVLNFARNGRSSKSFLDEGAWQPVLAAKPDFILIQFGHNDQPGKGPDRETDPATTYRRNIVRYVNEARAAGAKPVLVTSIVRRNFSAERKFQPDALAAYAEEVRKIGAEMRVPVIDLYTATREQAERLGPERSEEIGRRDAAGKLDRTHLGPKGRHDIGEMAARELARLEPSLRPYLKPSGAVDYRVVVAADGSGDYKTIQYAVDHAPTLAGRERLIIEIRPGTYNERVKVPQDRPRVTFQGSDAGASVITANMSAKAAGGTFLSATVTVDGAAFEAENITFENTFGVGSQAVALSLHSDRAILRKCRFLGWQDTLYAAAGRQYYKDCYIEGHVDFIFGNAAAVFDNCEIHSRDRGYITAHSRTLEEAATGYVFEHCRLTGEAPNTVFLGRPWRPFSRVVFIDCWMGDHIRPEGWDNWGNPSNEQMAWYGESGSTGPGADKAARAAWAHRMTAAEADRFRPGVFLAGADGWNPVEPASGPRP